MRAIVSLLVAGASLVATAGAHAAPYSNEYYVLRKEMVRLQNRATELHKQIAHWENLVKNRNAVFVPPRFLGPHQTTPVAVSMNTAVQRISQRYYQMRVHGTGVRLVDVVKSYMNFSNQMKRQILQTKIGPLKNQLRAVQKRFKVVYGRILELERPQGPRPGHGPSGNLTHGTGGNLSNLYWRQGGRRR